MRLEDLTIALRPRGSWEAVDLGCSLTRRDFGRLLALWGITVVPLWIGLALLFSSQPAIFYLIAWWLKPLYDRVPLYFISRAAFGVRPTITECLRAWPRLWSRFLFSALIFRRLSFIRSFALPIWMLEGQRGKAVRNRVKALATDASSSGALTSLAFLHLEFAVFIGLWVLTSYVAPDIGVPEFDFLDLMDEEFWAAFFTGNYFWYLIGLHLLAITLVELFYVGAGFGLYLNSRIKLEGWDIELTFRKLAARLQPAAAAIFALLLTCTTAGAALRAPAAPAGAPPAASAGSAEEGHPAADAAQEILSRPEFTVHKRMQKVLDFGDPKAAPDAGWLAPLLYLLGWALAAGLAGLLIWWLVRNRHLFHFSARLPRSQAQPDGPRVLMGMNISRDSLPADLIAAARDAWQQGHLRDALSLLYRGSLSRLVEQRRLPIRDSDTEDDCLAHVAKSGERPVADYFATLTALWVRAAYAGIEAGAEDFEFLCRSWPFDQTASVRVRSGVGTQALLVLGLGCLLSSCKDQEVVVGYKGPARSDPFYAAQLLLEEFDIEAEKLTVLKRLPEDAESTMLVLSGEGGMVEGRARQLLTWVENGGHLVYALSGCRPYNDHSPFAPITYFGNKDRVDPLLRALNVEVQDRRSEDEKKERKRRLKSGAGDHAEANAEPAAEKAGADEHAAPKETEAKPKKDPEKILTPEDVPTRKYAIDWNDRTYQVELPDFVTFKLDREIRPGEFAAGPVDQAVALGLRRGLGRLTLINHARPLRNRYLGVGDHAAWLVDLAGEDVMDAKFVLSLEGSFWGLLWTKAWMPLSALAALVLFWLWRNLPRFGPVSHIDLHQTKQFSEHIGALGQFFHALRRDDILVTAAAEAVRSRALHRFPQFRGAGDAALIPRLAELSALPEDRVTAAFSAAPGRQPHHLVRMLHDLQALRQALA